MRRARVFVLLGPTGVGKTVLSLELAERLGSPIISADSRQVYKEIPIVTAAPTPHELAQHPHQLIGHRSIHEYYSASAYEREALSAIEAVHRSGCDALVVGGSMMYIDALCYGVDEMPDVRPEVRQAVWARYEAEGLGGILAELAELDPLYYARVDKANYKRVLHGYEMCLSTGRPFSSFHTGRRKERPWEVIKLGLIRPRGELYERIDRRVDEMLGAGLEAEARSVYPYRGLNALNTVGLKELFDYFDGATTLGEAIRLIKRNSRHYARKQLSWWHRDPTIRWHHPEALSAEVQKLL